MRGSLESLEVIIIDVYMFSLYYDERFIRVFRGYHCCNFYSLGYMMGNLPKNRSGIVSKEHICEGMIALSLYIVFPMFYFPLFPVALILLLRDSSSQVRASAAEALSLLHEY